MQLERMLENFDGALELVTEALRIHTKCDKLWMISGQLHLEKKPPSPADAMKQFEEGRKQCPKCIHLWLCTVDIYVKEKNWSRARAILEEVTLGDLAKFEIKAFEEQP